MPLGAARWDPGVLPWCLLHAWGDAMEGRGGGRWPGGFRAGLALCNSQVVYLDVSLQVFRE
jgi:hypothetical protein